MSSTPKILLIGPASPHVAAHYERIQSCVGEVHVVTNGALPPFAEHQVTRVDFRLRNPLNWFTTPRKIRKIIRNFEPDLIHVHQANAVALHAVLANRRAGLPLILTVWGSDILVSPHNSALLRAMVRFVLKRSSAITAGSNHLAARTRELLPSKKANVYMCNFGVAANDLDVPKEDIVYTNRHHYPLYRVNEVIRAFARFVSEPQRSHWKLVIAGDGPETPQLKQLATDFGIAEKCSFTGFLPVHENHLNYAKARVYISLPNSDSAAISLLEAMYHRCIPVVSDLAATNEWVTHGVNGIVVSSFGGNPIEQAIALSSDKLLSTNRNRVIDEAGTEAATQCFCKVLRETIDAATA